MILYSSLFLLIFMRVCVQFDSLLMPSIYIQFCLKINFTIRFISFHFYNTLFSLVRF